MPVNIILLLSLAYENAPLRLHNQKYISSELELGSLEHN